MRWVVLPVVLLITAASVMLLWLTDVPLGVPGEWTWDRVAQEDDAVWNGIGCAVTAALYVAAVRYGWSRMSRIERQSISRVEVSWWLAVLTASGFAWSWIVQESSPPMNRLGKAAFVLYYPSSSGYFTKSRYEEPSSVKLLAGYESLMKERDVLHVGTHPPGLFLVFHGLITICESSPTLGSILDAIQPESFRDACDVITSNTSRSQPTRVLKPVDRRVLWLATLLVMASSALTVVPLYGMARLTQGREAAWFTASLWPAIPAALIFVPKSDVVFAFIGMLFVWVWFVAVSRRSFLLAFLAGGIAWTGMMLSLAFLPVFLFAALATAGLVMQTKTSIGENAGNLIRCVVSAKIGFLFPTLLLGWLCHVNLLVVWWLNYQNHAGFYQQYTRTYWKWLLVNPVEIGLAVGGPIAVMTLAFAASSFRRGIQIDGSSRCVSIDRRAVVCAMLFVGAVLWLTGKNSGEVARLWIIFLPWLAWMAGQYFEQWECDDSSKRIRMPLILLAIQMVACFLTTIRVNGFHFHP